jgi:very-short-patch-repair endonuclease
MRKIHNLENRKIIRRKLRKSSTPQEVILWSRIRKNQLGYKFGRQHSIGKYKEYDEQRDKYLKSLEFTILRFWDNDINKNLEGVLLKILEYLK